MKTIGKKNTILISVFAQAPLAGLIALTVTLAQGTAVLAAPAAKAPPKATEKTDKPADKEKAEKPKPEPVIENVQNVSTDQLIDKPHDYLNKNVKFVADFASFSSLALDYKPAMRASKLFLSFLVMKENSKVPLSEIKLAMAMPKEDDKAENKLLQQLKEGDQVEITGKVFSTALDDPWLDVLRLKKLKSAPETEKDKERKAEEKESELKNKKDNESEVKKDKPADK